MARTTIRILTLITSITIGTDLLILIDRFNLLDLCIQFSRFNLLKKVKMIMKRSLINSWVTVRSRILIITTEKWSIQTWWSSLIIQISIQFLRFLDMFSTLIKKNLKEPQKRERKFRRWLINIRNSAVSSINSSTIRTWQELNFCTKETIIVSEPESCSWDLIVWIPKSEIIKIWIRGQSISIKITTILPNRIWVNKRNRD